MYVPLAEPNRRTGPPLSPDQLPTAGLDSPGGLTEGRVANLIDADLRGPFNHFPHALQHSGIDITAIGVGVLLLIPQTDSDGFRASRHNERHFILEALLGSKVGMSFLLHYLRKLSNTVWFQSDRDTTIEHVTSR